MHRESLGDSSCVGRAPGIGRVERECAPAKPEGTKKGGDGEKIHYVKDSLAGKYQNVSSTSDRGRGEKLTGGICQLLKQAWIGAGRRGAEVAGDVARMASSLGFFLEGKKNTAPQLPSSYFSPLGVLGLYFNCGRWCFSTRRARAGDLLARLLVLAPPKQRGAPSATVES